MWPFSSTTRIKYCHLLHNLAHSAKFAPAVIYSDKLRYNSALVALLTSSAHTGSN